MLVVVGSFETGRIWQPKKVDDSHFPHWFCLEEFPPGRLLLPRDLGGGSEQIAPRQAKVVELRYFGGLSEEEIVEVLKTSPRTVRRDWEFARAWLARELHA